MGNPYDLAGRRALVDIMGMCKQIMPPCLKSSKSSIEYSSPACYSSALFRLQNANKISDTENRSECTWSEHEHDNMSDHVIVLIMTFRDQLMVHASLIVIHTLRAISVHLHVIPPSLYQQLWISQSDLNTPDSAAWRPCISF